MTKNEIKQRIIQEITKDTYADLVFLYWKESLDVMLEVLEDLLEEKKEFYNELFKKPLENIEFDDLIYFDKLSYLFWLINHLDWVNKNDKTEEIIEIFEPKLSEFRAFLQYNKSYYDIVCYLLKEKTLNDDQKRILELEKKDFEINWINLNEDVKNELKEIEVKLSILSNEFSNNLLKDKKQFSYHISDITHIKNLPQATLDLAFENAQKNNKSWYLFDANPNSYIDIIEYCDDKNIRKDFIIAKKTFASFWEYDNRQTILDIIKLSDKKAKLIWYNNFAELSLSSKMAKDPKKVFDIIWDITKKAKQKALLEVKEIQDYFNLENLDYYDFSYYARKYKEEKYDFDDKELKKYFEFENVKKYLFDFVSNFYSIEIKEINSKTYSDDVKIYEIYKNNKLISYYLLDPFFNPNKRQWAWADNLRWRYKTKIPFVVNVCNFQKQQEHILLTKNDVETLFHEFWHALHEMLSQSEYSSLSWFNVEWDFVELPSQLHENWVNTRESLEKLWKHYITWEKIPKNILDKLDSLKTYMSWNYTLIQNEYTFLDLNLYYNSDVKDVSGLDKKCLSICNEYWIFTKDENYKMYTSFSHIFWWWYAAWYYSYMWAELLEACVFEEIKRLWMFDKKVWEKFINTILWQWTRKEANLLFKDFMWKDLDPQAFMVRKGFI